MALNGIPIDPQQCMGDSLIVLNNSFIELDSRTLSISGTASGSSENLNAIKSLSANWNSVYSTVNSNSAINWNYQGSDVKALSANWQNAYTNFSTQSANNISVYSTVNSNSAAWGVDIDTGVRALTSNWQNAYTSLSSAVYNNFSKIKFTATGGTTYNASPLIGSQTNAYLYRVDINGVSQEPGTNSSDGDYYLNSGNLIFSTAPATGTKIVVIGPQY